MFSKTNFWLMSSLHSTEDSEKKLKKFLGIELLDEENLDESIFFIRIQECDNLLYLHILQRLYKLTIDDPKNPRQFNSEILKAFHLKDAILFELSKAENKRIEENLR